MFKKGIFISEPTRNRFKRIGVECLVYALLETYANNKGEVCCLQSDIQKHLKCSLAPVNNALNKLQKDGLISVKRNLDYMQPSYIYILNKKEQ